jgi:hypothetical protein
MRNALFLLLALGPAAGMAQSTFKCTDPQGRVTYSNIACEKQGLSRAGVVADRTSTLPSAPVRAPRPAPEKPAPAAEAKALPAAAQRGPQIVEPRIPRGAAAEAQAVPRNDPIEIPPLPTVKPPVK